VLPEARHSASCKDPTCFYTSNCSESLNHIIKQEVEWKESKLAVLIDRLKFTKDDQVSQTEKGEWPFT